MFGGRRIRCAFVPLCFSLSSLAGAVIAQGPSSMQSGPVTDQSEPLRADAGGDVSVALSNVPAYNWYHGCGPTAAASIVGYYDALGLDNLFTASGWDNVKFTGNIQDQISSPAHNAKYDPHPDDASLPTPPNTSQACWFRTSVNQPYGWSWLSYADDCFIGYAEYRGYECTAWNETFGSQFTWADLMGEIEAGRPMMFLVDTDGNGGTDHFVPVLGYQEMGGVQYYGCYTTWSENESVIWKQFRGMGDAWWVGYATFVNIVPERTSSLMMAMAGLAVSRRSAIARRLRRRDSHRHDGCETPGRASRFTGPGVSRRLCSCDTRRPRGRRVEDSMHRRP